MRKSIGSDASFNISTKKRQSRVTKSNLPKHLKDQNAKKLLSSDNMNAIKPNRIITRRATAAAKASCTETLNELREIENENARRFVESISRQQLRVDLDRLSPTTMSNMQRIEYNNKDSSQSESSNVSNEVIPGRVISRRFTVAGDALSRNESIEFDGIESEQNGPLNQKAVSVLKEMSKRPFRIQLKRLSVGTMNRMLGTESHHQENSLQIESNDVSNKVAPGRIISRRFSVDSDTLSRISMDGLSELEIKQEVPLAQSTPLVASKKSTFGRRLELNLKRVSIRTLSRWMPTARPTEHLIDDPVEDLQNEIHEMENLSMINDSIQVNRDMSSILSNQNIDHVHSVSAQNESRKTDMRPSMIETVFQKQNVPFLKPIAQSTPISLTPAAIVREARLSQDSAIHQSIDDDNATYFSDPTCESTIYFSPVPIVQNQQIQSSQTREPIPWYINGSFTGESIAAHCSSSSNFLTDDVEPKKGFIDSTFLSYRPFITYKSDKFAINCFDHGDKSIKHHFLSKFNRFHFPALNYCASSLKGFLYTTKITAHLLIKYSKIGKDQIKIMKFDERMAVGGAFVTAIEVPE